MEKTLMIVLLLLLSQNAGNCAAITFQPIQRPGQMAEYKNFTSDNSNVNSPLSTQNLGLRPEIVQIERALFGRTFANQPLAMRLSRIEKSLFTTTYPDATDVQRIDNIISNYNQINKYPNLSTSTLTRLENRVFNQSFAENTPERRVERLEQQLLGAVQTGDLNARIETLKIAAQARNRTAAYQNPMQGGWKGIASAIGSSMLGGSMLGGSMTGFTPSIDPFNNNFTSGYNSYTDPYTSSYANRFMNPSGIYRGVRTNHGHSDSYSNYGSGAGVTILD